MKYLAVAILALAGAAVAAAPQSSDPPPAPPPDLRQVLQHYHPENVRAPRQLTPAERAELRRQLSEYEAAEAVRSSERPSARGGTVDFPPRKEP